MKEVVGVRLKPIRQATWEKCKICSLHAHLGYSVWLLITQEMSEGIAKNPQMLPMGVAPRSHAICSTGGMRVIVQFIGLSRDNQCNS